jgi:beta-glucosidase
MLTENSDISQLNWKRDEIIFAKREDNLKLIKEAVDVARNSDIIILAIGENDQLCREGWAPTHIGDSVTLDLFGEQEELAKAIVETGKPVIVYLTNGRPLSINYLAEHAEAIIEGWYMGQETGTAAADVIFGDVNPSGKLTITFPKSVGQLPLYYNHKPSAQSQNYLSMDIKPLFAFGYGLSYTQYKYSKPILDKEKIKIFGSAKISVQVTNTGKVDGDEIVQMYIRDKVSSITRPIKELKGFERIHIKSGESVTVTFDITPEKLSFYNIDYKHVVEPGEFEIMVGSSSRDEDLHKVVLIVE